MLYLLGQGAPESDQMALFWFRRAAKQEDALAFAKLGLMYALGRGVPKDLIQAHMWYNLSAAQGEKHASEFRDALVKRMTPAQVAEAQKLAREWKPEDTISHDRPTCEAMTIEEAMVSNRWEIAKAQQLAREWRPNGKYVTMPKQRNLNETSLPDNTPDTPDSRGPAYAEWVSVGSLSEE